MSHQEDIDHTPLSLPDVSMRLRRCPDGVIRVFDPLRRRWVAFTPEERVRQHFVAFLVASMHYPPGRMANEVAISHNGRSRRCDTVIYDSAAQPVAVIEYKSPAVVITEKTFDQIIRYNMLDHRQQRCQPLLLQSRSVGAVRLYFSERHTFLCRPYKPVKRALHN